MLRVGPLLCVLLGSTVQSSRQGNWGSNAKITAKIIAIEAEHTSLLPPLAVQGANPWTPPVFDNFDNQYLFSWRVELSLDTDTEGQAIHARNVTQVSAVLTLSTAGRAPIVCSPKLASKLSLLCDIGPGSLHAETYSASLEVVLRAGSGTSSNSLFNVTKHGSFIRGLRSWGKAEWIGLKDAMDTAAQFRSEINVHKFGFRQTDDVAQAIFFASGLGGYRATVNSRPLDSTCVRGSVTEWNNRTFYFAGQFILLNKMISVLPQIRMHLF